MEYCVLQRFTLTKDFKECDDRTWHKLKEFSIVPEGKSLVYAIST